MGDSTYKVGCNFFLFIYLLFLQTWDTLYILSLLEVYAVLYSLFLFVCLFIYFVLKNHCLDRMGQNKILFKRYQKYQSTAPLRSLDELAITHAADEIIQDFVSCPNEGEPQTQYVEEKQRKSTQFTSADLDTYLLSR